MFSSLILGTLISIKASRFWTVIEFLIPFLEFYNILGFFKCNFCFLNFVFNTFIVFYSFRAVFTWLSKVTEELVWFWFYYALWFASVFTFGFTTVKWKPLYNLKFEL